MKAFELIDLYDKAAVDMIDFYGGSVPERIVDCQDYFNAREITDKANQQTLFHAAREVSGATDFVNHDLFGH